MSGHERERLSAWLDGELLPADRAQVDAHLAACAECSAFLADLAAADRAAAERPAEAPDGYFEGFAARVRGRIEAEAAEARPRRLPAWAWAAAAALVLAVVTPLTLRQPRPGPAALPATTAPEGSLARESVVPTPAARAVEPERKATLAGPAPAQTLPAAPSAASPAGPAATERGKAEGDFAREPSLAPPPPASVEARATLADAAVGQAEAPAAPAPLAAPEKGSRAKLGARAAEAVRAPQERSAESAGLAAVGGADSEVAFRRLDAVRPRSADGWRRLRDGWAAFVTAHPETPLTDEARVRAIEAGYEAWLTGSHPDDEAVFRRDARAYLERADARQAERVRRLLPPGR